MWTYKKSYDLLSEAYIKGEVDPYSGCFCMVGNLLGNKPNWMECRTIDSSKTKGKLITCPVEAYVHGLDMLNVEAAILFIKSASEDTYTPQEIADIEAVFLYTYRAEGGAKYAFNTLANGGRKASKPEDEEALWLAFVAGLEKIKEIHISKGEDVDQEIALPKRYEKVAI